MVPQVASLNRGQTTVTSNKSDMSSLKSQAFNSKQAVIHEQSLTQDRTQKEESTPQVSADKVSESTSEEYISEPEKTQEQQETGLDSDPNISYEQDPTDNSQVNPVKSTLNPVKSSTKENDMSTETSGKVLKLMYEASKEKRNLQLIHAVECNNASILLVLPLILQCTITFGVGYSETVEIIKTVQHLSKKWVIIKKKKTSAEFWKVFGSHTTPFKNDISFQSTISARDLAFLSHKTEEKEIPYAWYYLCHSIQNTFKEANRKVMSISEVLDIAKKCLISVDELPKTLNYLHKTGLLLYYEDILPNVLFEDTVLIVKILNSVILNPQNNGIIHESSLRQVEDVFVDDLFTFEDAIELLQSLGIISLINKQLFCMPTLLKTVIDEKRLSINIGNFPPLHIQYPAAPGQVCLSTYSAT